MAAREGEGEFTYLQRLFSSAWTIDAAQLLLVRPTKPLFKLGDGDVADNSSGNKMEAKMIAGTFRKELATAFAAEVGAQESFHGFAAPAAASAAALKKTSTKTFRCDVRIKAIGATLALAAEAPQGLLTADAKAFLRGNDAATIVRELGVFYAQQISVGGLVNVTTVSEMVATDKESSMQRELAKSYPALLAASLKAGGAALAVARKKNKACKTYAKATVLGGDASLFKSGRPFNAVLPRWSLTFGRCRDPVHVKLAPIWTIMTGDLAAKGRELKEFVQKSWGDQYEALMAQAAALPTVSS